MTQPICTALCALRLIHEDHTTMLSVGLQIKPLFPVKKKMIESSFGYIDVILCIDGCVNI